eukprot:351886-Chlamydomonas_euryale.AAC.4
MWVENPRLEPKKNGQSNNKHEPHGRVGSDEVGRGAAGRGAVGRGEVGRGEVGRGAVGRGEVGRGSTRLILCKPS